MSEVYLAAPADAGAMRREGSFRTMSEIDDSRILQDPAGTGARTGAGARPPLRERLKRLAQGPAGVEAMFVIGFLESSIVPVPIEIILGPLAFWQRQRVWLLTSSALAGCMLACVLFYFLGMFFEKTVGEELIALMGWGAQMAAFQADLKQSGFWLVASISLFPLPLQVATLGSGMFGYSFGWFFVAILLTRAIRFYGFVALILLFGPPVLSYFERLHIAWRVALVAVSIAVTGGLFVVL